MNGEEVLLCKQMSGCKSSTIALTAVPEDATDQMITKAYAAAAQCQQNETRVIRIPWVVQDP